MLDEVFMHGIGIRTSYIIIITRTLANLVSNGSLNDLKDLDYIIHYCTWINGTCPQKHVGSLMVIFYEEVMLWIFL
jgi:hypothetical protein